MTHVASYRDAGISTLKAFAIAIERAPRGTETLVNACALVKSVKSPVSIVRSVTRGPVSASLNLTTVAGKAFVDVHLSIEAGYHIQSNKPKDANLIATNIVVTGPKSIKIGNPQFPVAKVVKLGFSNIPAAVFEGKITIRVPVSATKGKYRAEIRWQACDDKSCLAPVTVVLDVE